MAQKMPLNTRKKLRRKRAEDSGHHPGYRKAKRTKAPVPVPVQKW